nr:hypothetical protein [uncultured Flavobacterium sp.]
MNKQNDKANTYPKHDCSDIRNAVWTNTSTYTTERCIICDRIIKFKWKSFWKRLASLI